MKSQMNKIAIVGGGSAGWLSAIYLARHFQTHLPGSVQISLIESKDIATIGVGEATIPSICKTLRFLGIEEKDFMKATSATFKQAIRFDDWLHLPTDNSTNSFYHTFQIPIGVSSESIAPYWVMSRDRNKKNYVDYATSQGKVCEAGLGPFIPGRPQHPNPLVYAYHFDATQFAGFLKSLAAQFGVQHRIGTVTNVAVKADGCIDYLEVTDQENLEADFFIDCTGFASHLIEKKLGSPFLDQTSMLFCDRAVTVQLPYERPDEPRRRTRSGH